MTTISRLERCRRLPRNITGRDFVVGDLHGHRSLLEVELDRLGFDPLRDRVLSVGDLIDRGPESLATLALIEEPWFHAVLGNHELMLLNHLDFYASRVHSRKAFVARAGRWLDEALGGQRKTVRRLAERVAALPLALHVAGDVPFNVTHGDLLPLGSTQHDLLGMPTLSVHEADACTTSRRNMGEAAAGGFVELRFAHRPIRISDRPFGAMPLTYAGHSRARQVTVHNSYVYIDQGVGERPDRPAERRVPTVLDHGHFGGWLHAVTRASGAPHADGVPIGQASFS